MLGFLKKMMGTQTVRYEVSLNHDAYIPYRYTIENGQVSKKPYIFDRKAGAYKSEGYIKDGKIIAENKLYMFKEMNKPIADYFLINTKKLRHKAFFDDVSCNLVVGLDLLKENDQIHALLSFMGLNHITKLANNIYKKLCVSGIHRNADTIHWYCQTISDQDNAVMDIYLVSMQWHDDSYNKPVWRKIDQEEFIFNL